ncbi:hypothetical protein KAV79_07430, partial [Candidatus Aerophobetes bacterium]|nr:hypothetical protein [Candidatus Aerophobetes bacterium]
MMGSILVPVAVVALSYTVSGSGGRTMLITILNIRLRLSKNQESKHMPLFGQSVRLFCSLAGGVIIYRSGHFY